LIEAMSYGVPVISTRTGGIPELLKEGAGVLVAPADSLALADAIEKLMIDAGLSRELSQRGRERVENEFAIQKVIDMLLSHFSQSREPFPQSGRTVLNPRRTQVEAFYG
jgi:colanic acid/amylovoran biosynthesis glycosyltransferase